VAFSPDGQTLAGAGNGSTYLWDVATAQRTAVLLALADVIGLDPRIGRISCARASDTAAPACLPKDVRGLAAFAGQAVEPGGPVMRERSIGEGDAGIYAVWSTCERKNNSNILEC
jgi:hypothetical protein